MYQDPKQPQPSDEQGLHDMRDIAESNRVHRAYWSGQRFIEDDAAFDAVMAALWPRLPAGVDRPQAIVVQPMIRAVVRIPGADGRLTDQVDLVATGPLAPVTLSPRRTHE